MVTSAASYGPNFNSVHQGATDEEATFKPGNTPISSSKKNSPIIRSPGYPRSASMPRQSNYKFILVGNSRVGKTSLTNRCVFDEYEENEVPTRICQVVPMPSFNVEGTDDWIQAHIWDTLGQEKFHSLAPLFFRRSVGAFLVYDVTCLESFRAVDKWHQ